MILSVYKMEIPIEILLAKVLDMAVKETIETIMDSKCCMRSKAKWRKVLKCFHRRKEVRNERVAEILEEAQRDIVPSIFNYANRLSITHI